MRWWPLIMICAAGSMSACGQEADETTDATTITEECLSDSERCGYLTFNWYINNYSGTCAEAKARWVRLIVQRPSGAAWDTYQDCEAYNALSPPLPVGPYAVRGYLYDADRQQMMGSSRSLTSLVPAAGGLGQYFLTIETDVFP